MLICSFGIAVKIEHSISGLDACPVTETDLPVISNYVNISALFSVRMGTDPVPETWYCI